MIRFTLRNVLNPLAGAIFFAWYSAEGISTSGTGREARRKRKSGFGRCYDTNLGNWITERADRGDREANLIFEFSNNDAGTYSGEERLGEVIVAPKERTIMELLWS